LHMVWRHIFRGRENGEITAGKNEFEYTTCWLMVCRLWTI
jgi:hypothetical protein